MDQKRKRKTSKFFFKNTLQHCLSFWSLLSYFITQEVVESRDKCILSTEIEFIIFWCQRPFLYLCFVFCVFLQVAFETIATSYKSLH